MKWTRRRRNAKCAVLEGRPWTLRFPAHLAERESTRVNRNAIAVEPKPFLQSSCPRSLSVKDAACRSWTLSRRHNVRTAVTAGPSEGRTCDERRSRFGLHWDVPAKRQEPRYRRVPCL